MQGFSQPDTSENCPLCEQPAKYHGHSIDYGRALQIECDRCGRFTISTDALDALTPEKKYLLSSACRTWEGESLPRTLTTNMEVLIAHAPRPTIPEKCDLVLELIARMTERAGDSSKFDGSRDYPLVAARDAQEVGWIMDALATRGLLGGTIVSAGMITGTLSMAGWERVAELRRAGPNSAFVFVAMSFGSTLSNLYDGAIALAIREAGYEPIRVDRKEHTNSIDDEIVGNIRKSRFMVADFTGQRAGVYFEAGMMAGLGRNVIWMCDKSELEEVHFDVRQRNFIDWESVIRIVEVSCCRVLSALENPCVYAGFHDLQKHPISKRRFREPKSTSHISRLAVFSSRKSA
jgi:hypothetical protein